MTASQAIEAGNALLKDFQELCKRHNLTCAGMHGFQKDGLYTWPHVLGYIAEDVCSSHAEMSHAVVELSAKALRDITGKGVLYEAKDDKVIQRNDGTN